MTWMQKGGWFWGVCLPVALKSSDKWLHCVTEVRNVFLYFFNPHQYTLRSLLIRTPGIRLDPSVISSFITQAHDDVVSEMIF